MKPSQEATSDQTLDRTLVVVRLSILMTFVVGVATC